MSSPSLIGSISAPVLAYVFGRGSPGSSPETFDTLLHSEASLGQSLDQLRVLRVMGTEDLIQGMEVIEASIQIVVGVGC